MQYAHALNSRKSAEIIKVENGYVVVLTVDPPDIHGPDGTVVNPGCNRQVVPRTVVRGDLTASLQVVMEYMNSTKDCCEGCKGAK